MMTPNGGSIKLTPASSSAGIQLGLLRDFNLPEEGDPRLDDILHIDVKDRAGVIAGSNPRSVLAAVCRYLHENGCRWPSPGAEGELIPLKPCGDVSYFYVMLLNEIDEELTRRSCPMKIVFIAYDELLWPPETQRFHSPDRFSMLFAPSMRTYSYPYTEFDRLLDDTRPDCVIVTSVDRTHHDYIPGLLPWCKASRLRSHA